jgi:hypothetical protein
LEQELTRDFPGRDLRVVSGDCNITIPATLAELRSDNLDWAPTFAFLDPRAPAFLRDVGFIRG